MSATEQTVSFNLEAQHLGGKKVTVLQSNFAKPMSAASLSSLKLPAFGAVVLAVE